MCKLKVVLIFCANFVLLNIVLGLHKPMCDGRDCDQLFEDYLQKYQVVVPNDTIKAQYKSQFLINLGKIEEFNSQSKHSYIKGINRFSHLQYRHVASQSFGFALTSFVVSVSQQKNPASSCTLKSFDWRDYGAVSPVKDQGNCGSCFAFSAIAAIESQILITYNKNISLSEQYAMECIYEFWKTANDACMGGQPNYVYYLAIKNKGLPTTSSVPYLGYDRNICASNVEFENEAGITSYRSLSNYDENELACMLAAYGPISVVIFVTESLIQYKGGIYNDITDCGPSNIPNHAVVAVGYGIDNNTKLEYFILKNSWGVDWGEDGYIRIRKGVNMCNIKSLPQQPFI